MDAASRRAERESQRRYRQLQRDENQRAKMEARQQAAYEVEVFENQIERLLTVHKESPEVWDWNGICTSPPPIAPERSAVGEARALAELNSFRPGFLDKLLRRVDTKRHALERAVELAKAQDEQEYERLYQDYYQRYTDWDERRQLAWRIMQGDVRAYADALGDYNPLSDINELGVPIELMAHTAQFVEMRLTTNGDRLIPDQIKSLSTTGKLSAKPMAKSRFYEIYRGFVCGAALRAGRELFAFLPVQTVLVNIQANLLNTRTGQQGMETILSVAMSRPAFAQLNFSRLDPSDAMENFLHRMDFKRTGGFGPVEPVSGAEVVGFEEPERSDNGLKETPMANAPAETTPGLARLLSDHPPENGCRWIPAGLTASLVGIDEETKLTIGVSRRIAEAFESAGYCIEPDARFGSGSYDWDQVVGVFKPPESEVVAPSPAYHGAANLLKLCVLIAAADGEIDEHELGVFRQVVESQLHFSEVELKRLWILERLLALNAGAASKTLAKVATAVPADKRLLVGQVLVRVAAVDHAITKSEFRALKRVFKAFALPTQTLTNLVLQVCPSPDEVRIQEAGEGQAGEPIPGRAAEGQPQRFSLDMSKVYAITNETKEVVGILSVVMEDEQDETAQPSRSIVLPQAQGSNTFEPPRDGSALRSTRFAGLDTAFHPILERLLARDSWPRSDFHALAGEFHLMPLSLHDVINEWADESLGDFLLEGEDPIIIRRELILKETN